MDLLNYKDDASYWEEDIRKEGYEEGRKMVLRTAIIAMFEYEYSIREIAKFLSITEDTVRDIGKLQDRRKGHIGESETVELKCF